MQGQNKQKIVFVRHGHRQKPSPEGDNGLSEKGEEQVKDLCKAFEKGSLPKASQFWTSPKLRCQETLKPLSDLALSSLKVVKTLDEQSSGESHSQFSQRIAELLTKVISLNETIYLCSHGDVIPEAIDQLTGKSLDVSKGQAIVLTNENGKWEL